MPGSGLWRWARHRWYHTPNGQVAAVFVSVALVLALVVGILLATR